MKRPRVIVVGGGISGLSAAYFLSERGVNPVLLEQSGRLGGLIETQHTPYGDFEGGPDSFIASKPAVAELAQELGIADRIIGSNDEKRRVFIGRDGQLVPMPSGMVMMAPADLESALQSPLFSAETKAGFLREMSRSPQERVEDVTLETFVLDHFGREVLDTLAEPLLTGVYGGDPAQLSVRSVLPRFLEYERTDGSLIRAVQRERRTPAVAGSLFRSFAGGMRTLVDALESNLRGRIEWKTGCAALEVRRSGSEWSVRTEAGTEMADHVVIAAPAHAAARLLESATPTLSALLSEIPYSSAILVTFVFPEAQLPQTPEGFGFLVPRGERVTVAAATFIATKFPQRLRAGFWAVRCFIVGETARALAAASADELSHAALSDLKRWTGITTAPVDVLIRRWPDSMPQYVVGHAARIGKIEACLADLPGIHLCGNAYNGVGIPDSIRTALAAADGIAPYAKLRDTAQIPIF